MTRYLLFLSLIITFESSSLILSGQFPDQKSPYAPFAPDGIPFVVADSAFMPDMKGNHRAVVRISENEAGSVTVTLPWRRPDLRPETKKVVVYGISSGGEVRNVKVLELNSEKGRIAFEPQPGELGYYVYYLPYKFRRGWDDARYGKPWNDYLAPEYNPDPEWEAYIESHLSDLPEAKVERFESRSEFDAFTPMGLIATQNEITSILEKYDSDYLVYTEDRSFPIRLPYTIPARWAQRKPDLFFEGEASKNEYYCWQIGLWATTRELNNVKVVFSDFISGKSRISKDSVTCFNHGGINWDGSAVQFAVNVPKGNVQALWCGIQIPGDAKTGTYTGTATLTADGTGPREVMIKLHVNDSVISDRGDSETWRHSRLRWLNSTIGLGNTPVKPYEEMELSGNTIRASGKTVVIGRSGLPDSITINNRQVLNMPVKFEVHTTGDTLALEADSLKFNRVSGGKITWSASSAKHGLRMECEGAMEFDGCLSYAIHLSATDRDIVVEDVRMVTMFAPESAVYFMGAGYAGGLRPEDHTWDWRGPYDSYWMGGDKSGLHMEFTGDVYHGPLIADYKPGPPENWANEGSGQIIVEGNAGDKATVTASTGALIITRQPLHYGLQMLITPVRPVDPSKHFSERYYHANPANFTSAAEEGGANIENIHHAQLLNPFINYPFIVRDSLIKHIEEQHRFNRKVKLYYTVRELTTHCTETYALMSLKNQIFEPGPGYGLPWECEHLIDNYKPAWYTELPDQVSDAALVLAGNSRWINYYLEGLRWMLENYQIDGIYMDDVSFDRPVMQRIRRIMEQYRPGSLIDLHSNTGYSRGPANQYAGFFPYVDRLWFGESFRYNQMTPDQWFVTASGIPFGQMAEMLQDGGNRFLGMVYGETARDSYGEFSPRPVWELWKKFGITDSEMLGYWDKECPVKTSHPDVKATAFVKPGQTLVSIGNFDDNDHSVRLSFDWSALGLSPEKSVVIAPEIRNFQDSCIFKPNDEITVKGKQGWLLIIKDK